MELPPNNRNREDDLVLSRMWKLWFTPVRVVYPPLPSNKWLICLWPYSRPLPQLLAPLMDTASCRNSLLSTPSQHYPLLFLALLRPQLPIWPSFLPVLSLSFSRALQFLYICSLVVTGWVHIAYRTSNYGTCVRTPMTTPGLSTPHSKWLAYTSCLNQSDK